MACGSVFATETQLGRDLSTLDLTRNDLTSDISRQKENSPISRSTSYRVEGCVHEAIRFLQAEHEAVLQGLHQQIKLLQQRCDDLQFDAHLRHVTLTEEDKWRAQVAELTRLLEERTSKVKQLEEQLAEQHKLREDEHEQHRWKELQLQQQLEAGERRVSDLKGEVARLRAQVKDLKVYSTALRTVKNRAPSSRSTTSRTSNAMNTTGTRPLSRASRSSVGSLDSLESTGPRSLGSEDGEVGSWRGARLGGGAGTIPSRLHRSIGGGTSGGGGGGVGGGGGGGGIIKGPQSPTRRNSTFSLPPTQASPPSSIPPLASLQPMHRPSSSVTLPPITTTQSVARHVRKQLRLGSAPLAEIDRSDTHVRRDPA